MQIDELDEWQGLTPDMVREWLPKRGWSLRGGPHTLWERGGHNFADSLIDGNTDDLAFVIHCGGGGIAAGLSRQEALREINPRMRKGMPSQAALRAHRGLWLRLVGKENIATVLSRLIEEFPSSRDDESFFWPCDESGNKTRWPTDATGEML